MVGFNKNKENLLSIFDMANSLPSSVMLQPGAELKSGTLYLHVGHRRQRMLAKVYANTLDPLVVFYPDKVHCKHCGLMRLRSCTITALPGERDFLVSPKKTDDGKAMVFSADSAAERNSWVKALSSYEDNLGKKIASLRTRRMPSLNESLEEDEEADDSSRQDDRFNIPSRRTSRRPSTEFVRRRRFVDQERKIFGIQKQNCWNTDRRSQVCN